MPGLEQVLSRHQTLSLLGVYVYLLHSSFARSVTHLISTVDAQHCEDRDGQNRPHTGGAHGLGAFSLC